MVENSSPEAVQSVVDPIPADEMATPYFKVKELACKGTGEFKADPLFLCYLSVLRHKMGKPFIINSGCRAPSHNKAVGGHPNSLHSTENPKYPTATMAVDVSTRGWTEAERQKLIKIAKADGWNIGLAETFLHLDRGQDVGISARTWNY